MLTGTHAGLVNGGGRYDLQTYREQIYSIRRSHFYTVATLPPGNSEQNERGSKVGRGVFHLSGRYWGILDFFLFTQDFIEFGLQNKEI